NRKLHPWLTGSYRVFATDENDPLRNWAKRMDIDLRQLREVMRALKQFGVQELEITKGEEKIFLRREANVPNGDFAAASPITDARATPPSAKFPSEPRVAELPDASPDILIVRSPLVGTFYGAPSPESEPFVKIGQDVQAGQVLCIVEAMK